MLIDRNFFLGAIGFAAAFFIGGYVTAMATATRFTAFPVSVTGTELIYVVDGLHGNVRALPTYTVPLPDEITPAKVQAAIDIRDSTASPAVSRVRVP